MYTRIFFFSLVFAAAGAPLQAATMSDIESLYAEHCVGCHGPEVYTRQDRKVTSLPGLERQVRLCELNLGLTWFDEEITAMTDYLNAQYYKFKP